MNRHQIIMRLVDASMIACLILGNADVKTFVFWIVCCMVGLMVFALPGITPELAKQMGDNKVIGAVVHVVYVAALVYAGFPVLAAIYAVVAFAFRIAVEIKLAAKVAP